MGGKKADLAVGLEILGANKERAQFRPGFAGFLDLLSTNSRMMAMR